MKRIVFCFLIFVISLSMCSCALLSTRNVVSNNEDVVTVDAITDVVLDNPGDDSDVIDFIPKEYTEMEIITLFSSQAGNGISVLDCESITDLDGVIGAVLFLDNDVFARVAFVKEDGYFAQCGVQAKAPGTSQIPRLQYLGDGAVVFMIRTADGTERQCKITYSVSEDGSNTNFTVEAEN